MVCPRLMVVFNPDSVCLGSCILSSRIIMVSNFIGPRRCPRLLVALTQTPFVWSVRFILLDHEDKLFCRWLLSVLIYQVLRVSSGGVLYNPINLLVVNLFVPCS